MTGVRIDYLPGKEKRWMMNRITSIGSKKQRLLIPNDQGSTRQERRMSRRIAIPYDIDEEFDEFGGQYESKRVAHMTDKETGREYGRQVRSVFPFNLPAVGHSRVKTTARSSEHESAISPNEKIDNFTGELIACKWFRPSLPI